MLFNLLRINYYIDNSLRIMLEMFEISLIMDIVKFFFVCIYISTHLSSRDFYLIEKIMLTIVL